MTHRFIKVIEDLCVVRSVLVCLLSLVAYLFAHELRKRNFSRLEAAVLSLLIFMLPGFQQFVYMAHLPLIVGLLFAMYAYVLLNRSLILSALLLLCAFCTYQSLAFFFLLMLVIDLFFKESFEKKSAVRTLLFFCVVMGCYVLLSHFVLYPLGARFIDFEEGSAYYFIRPTSHLRDILFSLKEWIIPKGGSLWRWSPLPWMALGVIALFSLGLMQKVWKEKKDRWIFFLLILTVLTLSISPYILQGNQLPPLARVYVIFSAILFIGGVYFLKERKLQFHWMGGGILALLAVCANKNLSQSAVNSSLEVNAVYGELSKHTFDEETRFHYIVPDGPYGSSIGMEDIFNMPSTYFTGNVSLIHHYVLKKLMHEKKLRRRLKFCFTFSKEGDPYEESEKTIVIDLHQLRWRDL